MASGTIIKRAKLPNQIKQGKKIYVPATGTYANPELNPQQRGEDVDWIMLEIGKGEGKYRWVFIEKNQYAKMEDGGGIADKIIGIAKTHPYSMETETFFKPIDKNLPPKFYDELGIKLDSDKDFVEIVEIQFDTRKLITQGWHVDEDEPYFGEEQANDISELSKELQDWLVENLLSSIKSEKEKIANTTKANLIKELLEKTGKTKKECEEIIDRYNQIEKVKLSKGEIPIIYFIIKAPSSM